MEPYLSRDWSYVYKEWYSGPLPADGSGWTCDWKSMPQDLVWRLMPMKEKSFLELMMEDLIGVMGKLVPLAYYGDSSKFGNLVLFRVGEMYFMMREEKELDSVYHFEGVYESDEEFLKDMDMDKCVEKVGRMDVRLWLTKMRVEIEKMKEGVTETWWR
ncbi:hypothetical protein D9758_015077 [Tetrapyrgos nigripes]|uniref:Uncharacterized protein n=1 Tax=Tetrapyrgos nigripes TaxID=182062 RepID=A0A8H5C7R8_9AGAR|nr:hypothetical protein D9758_015077 [Tetrapyrgos nigripes]